jgi:hypothetical protein
VPVPGRGNATPQETIFPERSPTGLSVASSGESALERDAVGVSAFISCLWRTGKAREMRAFPASKPRCYARTAPLVFRSAITSPSVIFG